MCGIGGSFGIRAPFGPDGPDAGARGALVHRGPDGAGFWEDDLVSLLHWRLAVIDLSPAGHQPMCSADRRFVLCYNGEVYNFPELRAEIERAWQRREGAMVFEPHAAPSQVAGHCWRGRSDTEVILEGCALWGITFLERLNGIFAIALYDRQAYTLYLARDRVGAKPLYTWAQEDSLLFASEAKFFFRVPGFAPSVDPKGLSAYFTYGQCHGECHVLGGVRQLEPGEVISCSRSPLDGRSLVIAGSRLCPRARWEPVTRADGQATAELRSLLTSVVARQLVADVPVGVLLSGGVDSSVLTALTAHHLGPHRTIAFTLAYPGHGPDYDETDHALRVAKHLGVQHHVYHASSSDLIRDLEQMVWHYDEPFADAAALNVFLLSRMIRSRVTVALAGEGSDELFGGYRRYQLEMALRALGTAGPALFAFVRRARLDRLGWIPRRLQVLLRALSREGAPARYSSYLESEIPASAILRPEWLRETGVNAAIQEGYKEELIQGVVSQLCVVDQQFWLPNTYLQKSDKGGMAHGLEIRVPFLDNEVVAFANSLPDDQRIRGRRRKWLLQEAFSDLLPEEVFRRFKRGFGVPVGEWLRNELRVYFQDHVMSPRARIRRYVQIPTMEACFRAHIQRVRDFSGLLWKCLILELWLRHFENGFRSGTHSSR